MLTQVEHRIGLSVAAAVLLALTAPAPVRADAVTDWRTRPDAATTTRASLPRRPSTAKAMTLPARTPSTEAAARSTSSG